MRYISFGTSFPGTNSEHRNPGGKRSGSLCAPMPLLNSFCGVSALRGKSSSEPCPTPAQAPATTSSGEVHTQSLCGPILSGVTCFFPFLFLMGYAFAFVRLNAPPPGEERDLSFRLSHHNRSTTLRKYPFARLIAPHYLCQTYRTPPFLSD